VRQDIVFTTVLTALAFGVSGEFREMPGLRLNSRQAARLFAVAQPIAEWTLNELQPDVASESIQQRLNIS
jgi:hypothetical protein